MVETMPLFPLGTVLMPGAPLPLHVFEPRYRQMTIDLVTGTVPGKQFGVVAVREGWGPDDGVHGLHGIGCTASLREVRRLPDGRFDILTVGDRRFRLLALDDTVAPYLTATVEWLPDEAVDAHTLEPLERAARAAHRRYCTTARSYRRGLAEAADPADPSEEEEDDVDEAPPIDSAPELVDPTVLPHLLAADCLLPLDDRQELLEQTCPKRRLELVQHAMSREATLLGRLHAVWAPTAEFAVPSSEN